MIAKNDYWRKKEEAKIVFTIKIEEIIIKNPEINFYYLVFSAYKDTFHKLKNKFKDKYNILYYFCKKT